MVEGSSTPSGQRDLVVVALSGVQRFIGEARSTGDVRAASEIIAGLAWHAASRCVGDNVQLVFPSVERGQLARAGSTEGSRETAEDPGQGMPNRILFLAPAGTGAPLARQIKSAIDETWQRWVRQGLTRNRYLAVGGETPPTPGFPLVHWVCVPAGLGGYLEQWEQARQLLEARRRVRDFPGVSWTQRSLCSLSPRWPAEQPPSGTRKQQRDTLSAANWVKRQWRQLRDLDGFPSTSSIASVRYRQAVLSRWGDAQVRAAVTELMHAVHAVMSKRETAVPGLAPADEPVSRWFRSSGGPWVYTDQWQAQPLARETGTDLDGLKAETARGAAAARHLATIMNDRFGVPAPASYLAVIVQDLDGMGRFLSGEGAAADGTRIEVTAPEHARVSGQLRRLAGSQHEIMQSARFLGVPVYAGGDDLLAFTPAVTALAAARACHDAIPGSLPTASTAVLFFHCHAGLQSAMSHAREMLEQAKAAVPGKHALAVGYQRRSGAAELTIQPWTGRGSGDAPQLLGIFASDQAHQLSPRLVADLERDRAELAALDVRAPDAYLAELRRLVRRHIRTRDRAAETSIMSATATAEVAAVQAADALAALGEAEFAPTGHSSPGAGRRPEQAVRIGVFLRQEAR